MNHNELIEIINEAQTQIVMDNIKSDSSLRDLGADSLDMMNILLLVQDKSGVEIPDEELDGLTTIDAICNYVNRRK